MEKVIADTGFIVALANKSDSHHQKVKNIYLQHQNIIMPQTVLAEVAYLIGRESGIETLAKFLQGMMQSRFLMTALNQEDIQKTAEILHRYQDSRIDFVDATVMAIAERLNIITVLTLDRRDFTIYKPSHCSAFTLLP